MEFAICRGVVIFMQRLISMLLIYFVFCHFENYYFVKIPNYLCFFVNLDVIFGEIDILLGATGGDVFIALDFLSCALAHFDIVSARTSSTIFLQILNVQKKLKLRLEKLDFNGKFGFGCWR